MRRLRNWFEHPAGYALFIAVWMALFLLAVGLDGQSLPFTRNSEYSDAVTSHYPNALIMSRFLHGDGTLTNLYMMNGQPWLPNPLSKAFYPLQWLVGIFPPILHLNILLWLHLVIAAMGMRAFARALEFSPEIAGLVGLTFGFTPRLIAAAGAGHLDIVEACAWLPLVMLAVHHLQKYKWRATIGLGVASALLFLADVRIFALAMTLAGLYCLVRAAQSRKFITPVFFGLALLIAAMLTFPLWGQLLGELPKLSRAGLTEADAGVSSLSFIELFLGSLIGIQGGAHETMVYLSVPVLVLAGIAFLAMPRRVMFWILAVAGFGFWALGENFVFWKLLVQVFPFLLWLRVPARGWLIVAFGMTILAGYGLRALTERKFKLQNPVRLVGAGTVITGLACVILAARFSLGNALTAAAIIAVTCVFLFNWRRLTPLAWLALIIIDLTTINVTLIEGVRREDWLDRYQPIVAALQADQVDHVYSPTYSLQQQVAVFYRVPIIGGVDPFQYADYVKRFEEATGVISKGYSVTLPAFDDDPERANKSAVMDLGKLAALGVSHVVAAYPISQPNLELVTQINQVYIYRNKSYAPQR